MRVAWMTILAFTALACAARAQFESLPVSTANIAESPQLKDARVQYALVRTQLKADSRYRRLAEARFPVANAFYTLWNSGSHPLRIEGDRLLGEGHDFLRAKHSLDRDHAAYLKEVQQYGSTPITDANRSQMAAWRTRLDEWKVRGEQWSLRLEAQRLRLAQAMGDHADRSVAAERKWNDDLRQFTNFAELAVRLGKIDESLAALQTNIARDRNLLDRWKSQLPGFHADIEAMARIADETRRSNAASAVGLGFSIAIDATVLNNLAKEQATRAQIKAIKQALIQKGVRPDHAKRVLAGWEDGPEKVRKMRSARELIESLSQIMDIAGALDQATQKNYYEALAAALSMFVQHPVLKLIKTNVEVYTNLLHTGLSYATAKARVRQFAKLGADQLKAVDAVRKVAVLHQKQRLALLAEKKEVEWQLEQMAGP